ncbi:uncharacterized protein LOC114176202 isoform X1 [Vigna unguiculata]|uniref:uncharacterized protein LOC114176202 isoform X1 n=1 Tax=Vigna unguiculata TaxID=3917 RepID=UPI00101629C2|nr:uncharacterized protein LOC114176202 isoform X1 [Vigna unguiculata]
MVVKTKKWWPWLSPVSKKFIVRLIVRRLQGCDLLPNAAREGSRLVVEIRWKGSKMTLGSLRRNSAARNLTKEAVVDGATVVDWDEEFETSCNLNSDKDNFFKPWEIAFTLFKGSDRKSKSKVAVGTKLLNIAEFASSTDQKVFDLNIPLTLTGGSAESSPLLCISISLTEQRVSQEILDSVQRSTVSVPLRSAKSAETNLAEKNEFSTIGCMKVKILTELVSKAKKGYPEEEGSEGRSSRSDGGEYNYPLETDWFGDSDDECETDEGKENSSVSKSFRYGTLASANAGESFNSEMRENYEDWVYYSQPKFDDGCSQMEDPSSSSSSSEPYLRSSKRNILPWRKRKLSFRSPKTCKGEPLLKKAYAEEGGDDIDFDRRQLSSDESLSLNWYKTEEDTSVRSSISEFGGDSFVVGSWKQKEIMSRDGYMKLQTHVFFASIDQRSERAAGESVCTVLVAVIADWFQNNRDHMPIESQFDSLIREGSLEWRKLCDNDTYKERFPDKHFDLETIIQAKIRSLTVDFEKSFVGFFHPEGMDDEGKFDFLHGAMSFDSIWDEISCVGQECPSSGEPHVYIVSWNDHFFILKVESDCYYIIDTLGERLYEGCNQAYILKFDSNTTIYNMPDVPRISDGKTSDDQQEVSDSNMKKTHEVNKEINSVEGNDVQLSSEQEEVICCRGKEACKEYIKSFLAAVPIRELEADAKKGIVSSESLHHRLLQVEFHYTQLLQSCYATPEVE